MDVYEDFREAAPLLLKQNLMANETEKDLKEQRLRLINLNIELEQERKQILARKTQLLEAIDDCDAQLIRLQMAISINNDHFQKVGKKYSETTGNKLVQNS